MKFFTIPSSKNIIATLRIVTIETPELTFHLILYFQEQFKTKRYAPEIPWRAIRKCFRYSCKTKKFQF